MRRWLDQCAESGCIPRKTTEMSEVARCRRSSARVRLLRTTKSDEVRTSPLVAHGAPPSGTKSTAMRPVAPSREVSSRAPSTPRAMSASLHACARLDARPSRTCLVRVRVMVRVRVRARGRGRGKGR